MTKFDVVDEARFDAQPAEVFDAIVLEFSGRSEWWRPHLSAKSVGGDITTLGADSHVTVHRFPPVRFTCRTVEVDAPALIRVHYVGGAFRGEGTWRFEPDGDGTRLTFHWRTDPGELGSRIASYLVDVPAAHSQTMKAGFEGLAAYLRKRSELSRGA